MYWYPLEIDGRIVVTAFRHLFDMYYTRCIPLYYRCNVYILNDHLIIHTHKYIVVIDIIYIYGLHTINQVHL